MGGFTGKTVSILDRLPHFYHANEAGPLLLKFVDIFGRQLDVTEADEYRVLRAHHVETADNLGFQGYTAPPDKRGDLDKIFTLYLEAMGGTALLVKTSPRFTARSLDVRLLAGRFSNPDALVSYLKAKFAAQLCAVYGTGDADAKQAVLDLVKDASALQSLNSGSKDAWRIMQQSFEQLLDRYRVEYALVSDDEIRPGFVLKLLLGDTSTAAYIRGRLSSSTRSLLGEFTGSEFLDPRLRAALAQDLNVIVLRDPNLFRQNQPEFPISRLSESAAALVRSIYQDDLRTQYANEPNLDLREQLLDLLEKAEPATTPVGDDQARLNRLLLTFAFPTDFQPRDIPSTSQVRDALLQVLNRLLDVPDLYAPELFLELVDDYAALQQQYSDDSVGLNRSLLESVFPNEVEKSYAPYRERLFGLIQVLRSGASTRQGVLDIVAANLGIVGDDSGTRAAKSLIDIEEYDPKRKSFFTGNVALFQEFDVNNSNPGDVAPEIWLTALDIPFGLSNVRFVDTGSGHMVQVNVTIQAKDNLIIKENSVSLNTVAVPQNSPVDVPTLRPGISRWRFEADLFAEGAVRPAGRFDETAFDISAFAPDSSVVSSTVQSYAYTPGIFTVVIPWHIAGFTDKFEETPDHPRNQILDLVNRVRAAGVRAFVAYKQSFAEDHAHTVRLGLRVSGENIGGYLFAHTQDMADNLRASNIDRAQEDHAIADSLVLNGCFDVTYFDSLNTFAR